MGKILLSIITPNYNYSNFIGQTIESVIFQYYQNLEYIIIDDGSIDNSVEVIKNYQAKFPQKIKLIQQKNMGQTPAINAGLRAASGDILGWINSDDFYTDNILSEVEGVFNANPEIDIVYGNFNVVDINGKYIYTKRHFKFSFIESCFLGFGNTLTSNCIFWKKRLLDKVGLLNEDLKCNMDGEYFSRLTQNAKVHFLDKSIANFRQQEVSIAGKDNPAWNEIVKYEMNLEKVNAYQRLKIANLISYKIGKYIRYYFIAKRFLKKLIRADYYKIYKSKRIYSNKYIAVK
jgi:glycosyltransferase involved in cell wall biosynthesis